MTPAAEYIYVSWCYRCGEKNEQPGTHVKCRCGAEYWLEWRRPGEAADE